MSATIDISVIIPSFCPGEYLWECLDSLEKQTLEKHRFEVLLVLNGCQNPYREQIEEYISAHDVPVCLFVSETAGVSHARNIGLDNAKGEYITFIDDDDYVSPSYLAELLDKADKEVVSLSYAIAFDSVNSHVVPYDVECEYNRHATQDPERFYHARKNMGGPCMKLIHRDIISSRRFSTRFCNGEDSIFIFAISDKLGRVRYTSRQAIYYRRLREGSASRTQSRWNKITNSFRTMAAYSAIYWRRPFQYNFIFYFTRLLGSVHTMIS